MPLALTVYGVALALHIMAVIVAFGLPLSFPVLLPFLRSHHPRAMPAVHDAQSRLANRVTAFGTLAVLLLGLYLANKLDAFSEAWVQVPFAILIVVGGVGGAIIAPASRRMAELSATDVAAAGQDGPVAWSAEYESVYGRYLTAERALAVLVLVAIFFMAAKPFA